MLHWFFKPICILINGGSVLSTCRNSRDLHSEEFKMSSSLGTSSSASLSMMEESSLTSTLWTSRARTGAPRHDSAAMVNWISLLFNQWRTKLLWLPLVMESSEERMGISLKAFTAAATWNCKDEESWYLIKGLVDVSSFVWPLCNGCVECHKHLLRFRFECDRGSLWSYCLIVSHHMRQTLSVQDVRRQFTTAELKEIMKMVVCYDSVQTTDIIVSALLRYA